MNELEKLAEKFDEINEEFETNPKDHSDPLWHKYVAKLDAIADRIYEVLRTIPNSFPLLRYLLSSSLGHQTVAVVWIRFKKDPSHLNVVCYMLLNLSSNFLAYHILYALNDIMNQCDYQQLCEIEQALRCYSPPNQTSRYEMKRKLLNRIEPQIEFSISNILPDSYWWRDVETKFFNSLSGILQYRLIDIQIIRNKKLFEQFHNFRTQLGENNQILFVYHGSTNESLQVIAKTGFLEPNKLSNKITKLDQGYFGCGIYQGFAADYAILYSEKYKKSNEILLSMVLPGRSYIVKKGGEKYGQTCEPGFDSHISPERKEIV